MLQLHGMERRRLAVLLLAVSLAIMLPVATFAAQNATPGGLVPCGVSSDPATASQCEACNLVQLIQNIITFMIGIAIPVAVALFAYAGFLYFTSGTRLENIDTAKRIFKNVLFGFLMALTAWLVVNTVLNAVLDKGQYPNSSWFKIDCTTFKRPINEKIGEVILKHIIEIGNFTPAQTGPAVASYSCDTSKGFELVTVGTTQYCKDPKTGALTAPTVTYDNPTVSLGGGACSSFTSNTLLSCISSYESSCNPAIGSGVDIGSDGKPVSWGLTQWNISANPINCTTSGGTNISLNCPSAFNKPYTSSYHGTYVTDVSLYNKCVAWATDPTCNLQMASNLLAAGGGSLSPWGTAVKKNCQ
jgi:hypothetical protein